jgi:hypothetical protein
MLTSNLILCFPWGWRVPTPTGAHGLLVAWPDPLAMSRLGNCLCSLLLYKASLLLARNRPHVLEVGVLTSASSGDTLLLEVFQCVNITLCQTAASIIL